MLYILALVLLVWGVAWAQQQPYQQQYQQPQQFQQQPYQQQYQQPQQFQQQPYQQQYQQPQYQQPQQPQQQSYSQTYQQPGSGYYPQAPAQQAAGGQSYAAAGGLITVGQAEMGTNVVLGGTVVPYKEVTLAAQVPGRVEFIAGAEGDWFEKEKVLLAIDDDTLLAKRRQALAEVTNAESALRNAQVQYSRELWAPQSRSLTRSPGMGMPTMFDQMFTRNLSGLSGGSSPYLERHADLYGAGTGISQAQSRVLQARSALEEVDAALRDSRAISPFSGVIVKKLVEVGDTVQPGQPMLVFADTRYLQIRVDVPARLMPGLSKDMVVAARLDVGDTRVDARVAQIFPMADVERHTVTVKFDLPQGVPGGPGMYAEVMVPDPNVPARVQPVIPQSAIVWRGSLPAVFVINQENRTEMRLIRIGEHLDSNTVSVLSGLRAGERILASPPAGMASGWSAGDSQRPSPAAR